MLSTHFKPAKEKPGCGNSFEIISEEDSGTHRNRPTPAGIIMVANPWQGMVIGGWSLLSSHPANCEIRLMDSANQPDCKGNC